MKTLIAVLCILFSCLLPFSLLAQQEYDSERINAHAFKINFIFPGLEYEAKVMEDFTLCLRGGLGLTGWPTSTIWGERTIKSRPFLELQFRRYYRTKNTSNKGKELIGNSGDYFGLRAKYFYQSILGPGGDLKENYVLLAGPMYGLQRTFKNKLSWSFHVGVGGFLAGRTIGAAPFIGISIGFLAYDKEG